MSFDINTLNYEDASGHNTKIEWSGEYISYCGYNEDVDATDSDPKWIIHKFTTVDGKITQVKKKRGAWADRATMF